MFAGQLEAIRVSGCHNSKNRLFKRAKERKCFPQSTFQPSQKCLIWIEVKGIGRQENQGAAVLWGKPANMCQVPKRKKYKEIRAHKIGITKQAGVQ